MILGMIADTNAIGYKAYWRNGRGMDGNGHDLLTAESSE